MSTEFKTIKEFADFVSKQSDTKVEIRNNELVAHGRVRLWGLGLTEIPYKFSYVNGSINVQNNDLTSFEFLPYDATEYNIHGNPGVTGILKKIVDLCSASHMHKDVFKRFIQSCLEYDVWSDGKTNFDIMEKLWQETKEEMYFEDKDKFIYGQYNLIDNNDIDILGDFYQIDGDVWSDHDIFNSIIDKFSSNDKSERLFNFRLLASLMRNDDGRMKQLFIENGFEKALDYLSKAESQKEEDMIDKLIYVLSKKSKRDDKTKQRDEENDCLVFNASYQFIETDGGVYKKVLNIERIIKIDIYDVADLKMVNMMKMRTRFQNDLETYMIWVPKSSFDEYIESNEFPDYILDLIDQKKSRI